MKNRLMLFLFFVAASLVAQETQCPPGQYYSADFNTPPIYVGLGPNPAELPPFTPPTDSLRGIFWVHGLGGDPGSMGRILVATDGGAGTQFPARKTFGIAPGYTATAGLPFAGHELATTLTGYDTALKNAKVKDSLYNFIIAHSQGAMVSRMLDKELDDYPGLRRHFGIVSIGGPHLGAQIVNSRNDGIVAEFAADACSAVFSTGLAGLLGQYPILDVFVNQGNIAASLDSLCSGVATVAIPFALNGLFSSASNDYAVGAPVLADLQGHDNPETHKTSFYGVEYAKPDEDPTDDEYTSKQLIWRMLGTPPAFVSGAPVFTADEDQHLVDMANAKMAEYQAEYEKEVAEIDIWNFQGIPCQGIEWFFNPIGCALSQIEYQNDLDERDIYHNAWRWSQGVDRQWKIIIGAQSVEAVPKYRCTCEFESIPGEPGMIEETFVDDPADCQDYTVGGQHFECTASTEIEFVVETVIRPSDGVVTAESQKGFPGAAGNFRMNNANHFQERNCEATRTALLQLFDNGNFDPWFATKVK